jgi:hypothetical protein
LILYNAIIRCEGCYEPLAVLTNLATPDPEVLPRIHEMMVDLARSAGWTVDGAAHWCPRCVLQRQNETARSPRGDRAVLTPPG